MRFFLYILVFLSLAFNSSVIRAQQLCDQADPCNNKSGDDKVNCYTQVVNDCNKAENTLSSAITTFNSKIELSNLRISTINTAIDKLEIEIGELAGEIGRLEEMLTKRSELVLHRIPESYKRSAVSSFGMILLSSNLSEAVTRIKYISRVQEEDAQLLFQLKATQNNFNERKDMREKKKEQQDKLKKQIEEEKIKLDQQKRIKQSLLTQTKNSEAIYQQLLANAKAELVAINGIISGGGTETLVGDVNEGDRIASVIQGNSCNSSGTHLHFMVTNKGNSSTLNPFNFLKSVSYKNCSGYACDSADQDSFSPSGSWDWPIDPTIILNQGFGSTWATRNTWVSRIYQFHNGIDIAGSSTTIKAIQKGKLYRGFYPGVSCRLQYIKLEHRDNDYATYYLHVNF